MQEQVFTNYRLQLPDQELLGTLVVRDGKIADIQSGTVSTSDASINDGYCDCLLPGLIELHTDNLERNVAPRPGVRWPLEAAAVNHDRDLISAGITTVCDAIAIGDDDPKSLRMSHFGPMVEVIHDGQARNQFSANHLIHLRCELSYEHVATVVEQFIEHPLLVMFSLMDHTPGQRQFTRLDKFKEYYMGKHGVTEAQIDTFIQDRLERQKLHALRNRDTLVQMARKNDIALASHDDTTIEHVETAIAEGAMISEFPCTMDAAKAAHVNGLQVLMGSPNLVLGGSHSGNVSAMELVNVGLVDILSSDYVPRSLLQSIFLIAEQSHLELYQAAKFVTSNPARAIGLEGDRGSLQVGLRADLVAVNTDGGVPLLRSVYNNGQRVA